MSLQCYTEFSRSPQSNILPDKYEALTGCVLVESLDHCAVKDTWDRCYRRIRREWTTKSANPLLNCIATAGIRVLQTTNSLITDLLRVQQASKGNGGVSAGRIYRDQL